MVMKSKLLNLVSVNSLLLSALFFAGNATGQELILESAKLGPTNQYGAGVVINTSQHIGVRFHLERDTLITGIGGHVWVENFPWAGLFNATIVRLPNQSAFPAGDPFTEQEVVYSQLCTPTTLLSQDYIFPASAELSAGHYALLFGGVASNAAMPETDLPLRNPSFIAWNSDGWFELPKRNHPAYRFTLYGLPLP